MPSLSQIVSRLSLRRKSQNAKKDETQEDTVAPKNEQTECQETSSTHSSSSVSMAINVDNLEFAASRDLAQSLGQEWAPIKRKRELAAFPAFEYLLHPDTPKQDQNKEPLSRNSSARLISASKSNINRWSITETKSKLIKRVRSTPSIAKS